MSKKLKLSPWHDGSVKPVHVGVYERMHEGWYAYWNGKFWAAGDDSIQSAAEKNTCKSSFVKEKWRGILK